MVNWTISYEPGYSKEELFPVEIMILQKESLDELIDTGDYSLIEEAYIDLAIQLGWDINRYIKEILEEQANLVLSFDGEQSESLSSMMGNTAIAYVECYLRGEEFDDSFSGKEVYYCE